MRTSLSVIVTLFTTAMTHPHPASRSGPVRGSDSTAEHPAPAPALGTLRPALGIFHFVVLRRVKGDSMYRPFGQAVVTRDSEMLGAMAVVRNVADYDWGSGFRTVDTTVSLIGTLAPISERTHTPARIVSYDFHHLRSTGQIGPSGALVAIDDTLPQPAFNSTDLDMLLTSLPLDQHFHAVLPLYDPEFPGFRTVELQVTEATEVATAAGNRRVWLLAAREASHPALYYRIDVATHRLLQKDFGDPGSMAFRVLSTDDPKR